jgi:hypothetical protein
MIITILKNAVELYRKHLLTVVASVLVIWVPLEILSSYMDTFVFGPDDIRKSFKFAQFLDNFIGIIATAAVTSIGYRATLGEKATFKEAMSVGFSSWGRVWWTNLLSVLAIILGLLLLIVPGIFLLVRLALVDTIAVCEYVSGGAAMRRSYELTKGRFWLLFGLGLILGFMTIGLIVCTVLPAILIPALDHWLVDAATSLLADLFVAFLTLCMVSAYTLFSANAKPIAGEPIVETEKPCVQMPEPEPTRE